LAVLRQKALIVASKKKELKEEKIATKRAAKVKLAKGHHRPSVSDEKPKNKLPKITAKPAPPIDIQDDSSSEEEVFDLSGEEDTSGFLGFGDNNV
jgi:hypothetical protein